MRVFQREEVARWIQIATDVNIEKQYARHHDPYLKFLWLYCPDVRAAPQKVAHLTSGCRAK